MPTPNSRSTGRWLRWLVRRLARIYYPVIEITGKEKIPGDGPLLICINHPNSLLDPILVGEICNRPVRFMAKAPLFQTPVLGHLMRSLGMIPAYRGRDDRKQVKRNLESLDAAADVLVEGDAFGIFPEGKSHDEYHVELVRTGAARIALRAQEAGVQDLVILPLGLNYSQKETFRSAVWAQVGQPIRLGETPDSGGDRQAMRELTRSIQQRLESVVVHLNQTQWQSRLIDLESLFQAPTSTEAVHRRKQIADRINALEATDPERTEQLARRIEELSDRLKELGLDWHSLVVRFRGGELATAVAQRVLLGLILLPPALAGLAFHLVPFVITRLASDWVRPPGRTAISLYRLLLGVPIYALWYAAALWLTLSQNVPAMWILLGMIGLPLSGLIASGYWPWIWRSCQQWIPQLRLWFQRKPCEEIRQQRDKLREELLELAAEEA